MPWTPWGGDGSTRTYIGSKDSIHSKDKLRIKYPGVNVSAIQTLYGLNVSPMAQDRLIFACQYKLPKL